MAGDKDIVYFSWEDVGSGLPFAIVRGMDLVKTDDIFKPSLRDFHVIFWFKKGTGTYYIDFEKHTFQPGTIALIPRDQVNYFEPFDKNEVEIQSVVFNPDFIYRKDDDIRHLFNFTVASHIDGIQILTVEDEEAPYLEMISTNMLNVYQTWNDNQQKSNAFYHWLSLFLISCKRLRSAHATDQKMDDRSLLLLRFSELLEKHFKTEFKVDFYINEMNISIKGLANLTKDRFKLSPKAVIDQRRVLEIKRLLRATNTPVKNIAYDMGFDEPTNMVKYFKKHTGFTPRAFREEKDSA